MEDDDDHNDNAHGGADDPIEVEPAADDDAEDEDEDGIPRNDDGTYDGGVACSDSDSPTKTPAECDLILFLECTERLPDLAPRHTLLRPGVTVSVGLDKNTKLSAVFQRYCDFLNEHYPTTRIETDDLDFLHCTVLNGNDTSEASALMKNDRIRVQKNRKDEREADAEEHRLQRETDREYFRDLKKLSSCSPTDVVLDCRGKLVDDKGLNQEVLRTDVRGHSVILAKRCKWLGDLIKTARHDLERQSVVSVPEQESQLGEVGAVPPRAAAANSHDEDDDDDDGIEALPYAPEHDDDPNRAATQIENDDDDEMKMPRPERQVSEASVFSSSSASRNPLWVTIPNHPPDAVRLLLEYCYTNRVVQLGQQAFLTACRTKNDHRNQLKPFDGPVAPYHNHSSRTRGWPNRGHPVISFPVALAGISLAEEANMKRLSLMCEVAAAQLVESSNVVEALTRCSTQEALTGNALPRLRKAAMNICLRSGPRGVVDLCRTPTFRRALEEKSAAIVPSLLLGTMEVLTPEKVGGRKPLSGCKRELSEETQAKFEDLDKEDTYYREVERRNRRAERQGKKVNFAEGGYVHEEDWTFEQKKKSKSLKRVPHHGVFSVGRSSPRNASYKRSSKRRRQI